MGERGVTHSVQTRQGSPVDPAVFGHHLTQLAHKILEEGGVLSHIAKLKRKAGVSLNCLYTQVEKPGQGRVHLGQIHPDKPTPSHLIMQLDQS